MRNNCTVKSNVIAFNKLTQTLMSVILITFLGMTLYHNGFYEKCPICLTGKSYVDKMIEETVITCLNDNTAFELITVFVGFKLFYIDKKTSGRSPPAPLTI